MKNNLKKQKHHSGGQGNRVSLHLIFRFAEAIVGSERNIKMIKKP